MTTEVAEKLYYRIGEVEAITAVPAYVLRYWESEFKLLRPKKNRRVMSNWVSDAGCIVYSFVIVSSRFKSTRATIV